MTTRKYTVPGYPHLALVTSNKTTTDGKVLAEIVAHRQKTGEHWPVAIDVAGGKAYCHCEQCRSGGAVIRDQRCLATLDDPGELLQAVIDVCTYDYPVE